MAEYAKLIAYAKSVNFAPDYPTLLGQLHRFKPEDARAFAVLLLQNPEGMNACTLAACTYFSSVYSCMYVEIRARFKGFLHEHLVWPM